MQAVRRATRALAFVLSALALAGAARGGEVAAAQSSGGPAASLVEEGTSGRSETVARLGSGALGSEGAEATADGVRTLRAELERLRLENDALRTDLRSTDRLVGAGLLAAGMLLGALLRAAAGRRPQPRIRF